MNKPLAAETDVSAQKPAIEQVRRPAIITRTTLDAQSIANSITLPKGIRQVKNGWGPLDFAIVVSKYEDIDLFYDYGSLNIYAGAQGLQEVINFARTQKPDANIFLVMGEEHDLSSNIHFQAAMSHLNPGATLALELPYNELACYGHDYYEQDLSQHTFYNLHEYDPLGHIFARAVMADNAYLAPLATDMRLQAALASNAPIILVDMARTSDREYLDPNGALFKELVQQREDWQKAAQNGFIKTKSVFGMDIRNAGIAILTTEAVEANNESNVTIVSTGAWHLGNKNKRLSHAGSLPVQIAKRRPDDIVISVSIVPSGSIWTPENRFSSEALNDPRILSVTFRCLSQRLHDFDYGHSQYETAETVRQSFIDANAEPPPFPIYPYRDDVEKELETLITEYEAAHPAAAMHYE